jgi:hypothetical protein
MERAVTLDPLNPLFRAGLIYACGMAIVDELLAAPIRSEADIARLFCGLGRRRRPFMARARR